MSSKAGFCQPPGRHAAWACRARCICRPPSGLQASVLLWRAGRRVSHLASSTKGRPPRMMLIHRRAWRLGCHRRRGSRWPGRRTLAGCRGLRKDSTLLDDASSFSAGTRPASLNSAPGAAPQPESSDAPSGAHCMHGGTHERWSTRPQPAPQTVRPSRGAVIIAWNDYWPCAATRAIKGLYTSACTSDRAQGDERGVLGDSSTYALPSSLQAASVGRTKVLLDERAIEGLVEALEVAQVCIQARPVAQLRRTAPSRQHAQHQDIPGSHMLHLVRLALFLQDMFTVDSLLTSTAT